MKNSFARCCLLFLVSLTITGSSSAQTLANPPGTLAETLPGAPQMQQPAQTFAPASRQMVIPPPRKYAQVIEPGQTAETFSAPDKIVFSFTEVARPITLLPALYSASYEQLFQTDPKYGNDAGAYGEKLGAALLRRATLRVFSDGIFAAAFHQDPRYYRVVDGSIVHRGLLSASQAFIRRGDNGDEQINYSGLVGRAASAALVVTYYPQPSVTGRVVALTFATSIASDMGGNLVLEFLPNVIRKFPIMKKLRLE